MAQPMSILVETFGTNVVDEATIARAVREVFDLRPGAIVRDLDLKRPIYRSPLRTGTSAAPGSPGSRPTGSTRSRRPSACDHRSGSPERHRTRSPLRLSRP
jgi:hypothetical protein